MSYVGMFVMVAVFFCIGIMAGMVMAFNAIIEIVTGLVNFLIERREYTPVSDIEQIEE